MLATRTRFAWTAPRMTSTICPVRHLLGCAARPPICISAASSVVAPWGRAALHLSCLDRVVCLRAGDCLVLPDNIYHDVECTSEDSMSVSLTLRFELPERPEGQVSGGVAERAPADEEGGSVDLRASEV
eukprot:UN3155